MSHLLFIHDELGYAMSFRQMSLVSVKYGQYEFCRQSVENYSYANLHNFRILVNNPIYIFFL